MEAAIARRRSKTRPKKSPEEVRRLLEELGKRPEIAKEFNEQTREDLVDHGFKNLDERERQLLYGLLSIRRWH
jgi:uncharacterized protein YqeY